MDKKIKLAPAHVGISVPDLEKAVNWYDKVLGFAVISDRYQPALCARVAFLERDGFCIELFQHDHPNPLPADRREPDRDIATCGTKHLCFYTQDMRAMVRHFGVCRVDLATQIFSMGETQVLFIRDCAGNLLEFIQKADSGRKI